MRTIVITQPYFFVGEAEQITLLLQRVDLVHIRKPNATAEEVETLLQALPAEARSKIVLHDHHALAMKYGLYGVHLNSRNSIAPQGWRGSVSRSCHTLEEVKEWKDKCNYISLSPIFDSISKQGYHSAFTKEQLREARREGIIDEKVYALGGVTFSRMDEVREMGFGGAMILGDAWKKTKHEMKTILTIAGSDTSAGAGIQQDLKTITSLGHYAATVITAITAQNTIGVQGVMPVPADMVREQIMSVLSDLNVSAIKIGMIPNRECAEAIKQCVEQVKCPIVLDPVMISTSGTQLMSDDCVDYLCKELFPLCSLITPNIPEAEKLKNKIHVPYLLKGGHADGNDMTDTLIMADGSKEIYTSERIESSNLHGTGCTLSSAIATFLAEEKPLKEAVRLAKTVINKGIRGGRDLHIGHGNGPLWFNNNV